MRGTARWLGWCSVLVLVAAVGCGDDGENGSSSSAGSGPAAEPAEQADYTAADVGTLTPGPGAPSPELTGSWPQFRGTSRDAIAHEAAGLAPGLPQAEPLWTIDDPGIGYAGAAIRDGRLYYHGYDDPNGRGNWSLRCVSLADGREIWRWSYRRTIRPNHAITRTVPATDGRYVVSLDPKGVLHGFDAATGERLWARDLPAEYDDTDLIPQWYNGQCPLIDEGRVILGIGSRKGNVLMAALDPATGEYLWKTPNPGEHRMSHASVMPMTLGGTKQYVWCTVGKGLAGVDAADGTLLWELPWEATNTSVSPSPLQLDENRLMMTSGYRAGTIFVRVTNDAGRWSAAVEKTFDGNTFESDTHTPILWQGHIYAVNNATEKGTLACLTPEGEILWEQSGADAFGLGPYMIADGKLYVLEATGMLHVVDPSPAGYRELARAQVVPGHEAWAPLAIAAGRLIARDMDRIVCLQIAE